jgi:anti-sigma regulatory factor (Ser/Thr protein kinase)
MVVTLDGDGDGAGGTTGLRHRVLIAGSPTEREDVVDVAVAGALAEGDPLLLVVDEDEAARLRRQHGPGMAGATVLGPDDFYTQPAWTLARFRHEVEARTAPGTTLRVVAQPGWWDRPPAERDAWLSVEGVANAAFASAPLEVLCTYDGAAPPDVLEGARHTHPEVVASGRPRRNPTYTDPALYCTRHRDRPLPPLPGPVAEHPFNGATLAGLRRAVTAWATEGGLPASRVPEVVLAVHEVGTNSVRHGGGEGVVRLGAATGSELVAEVEDVGVITAPFAGLLPPPRTGEGGYGLWLVHQLVELVEIRSGPTGSVVRLHTRRGTDRGR